MQIIYEKSKTTKKSTTLLPSLISEVKETPEIVKSEKFTIKNETKSIFKKKKSEIITIYNEELIPKNTISLKKRYSQLSPNKMSKCPFVIDDHVNFIENISKNDKSPEKKQMVRDNLIELFSKPEFSYVLFIRLRTEGVKGATIS